ncbi:hypothetical protein SedNR2807_24770 [Citrobacter sedlakii]
MGYFTVHPDDVAARFGKRDGHSLAKSGIATGNKSDFTCKRKRIQNHSDLGDPLLFVICPQKRIEEEDTEHNTK